MQSGTEIPGFCTLEVWDQKIQKNVAQTTLSMKSGFLHKETILAECYWTEVKTEKITNSERNRNERPISCLLKCTFRIVLLKIDTFLFLDMFLCFNDSVEHCTIPTETGSGCALRSSMLDINQSSSHCFSLCMVLFMCQCKPVRTVLKVPKRDVHPPAPNTTMERNLDLVSQLLKLCFNVSKSMQEENKIHVVRKSCAVLCTLNQLAVPGFRSWDPRASSSPHTPEVVFCYPRR